MAEDVTVVFRGLRAQVKNNCKDSVLVQVRGANVEIESLYEEHELGLLLKGMSQDGSLVLKTKGKAEVSLDNLQLTSRRGAALWLKNKKRVKIVAKKGTRSRLSVEACPDTASMKQSVIFAKDKLKLGGKGTLEIMAKADGVKGINAKKDLEIENLALDVQTLGQNLGKDTTMMFGGFPGGPGGFPGGPEGHDGFHGFGGPGGFPGFDELPDSVKAEIEAMRKRFEEGGGFPGFGGPGGAFPGGGGFGGPGGFPGFGGPGGESGDPDEADWGFKQRYVAKTKGIKSEGMVTISNAKVVVKTVSAGAEGIEGKKGVVVRNSEVTVDAIDDAINADAPIEFVDSKVVAESHGNDAIDANYGGMFGFGPMFGGSGKQQENQQEPAIIVNGGEVYGWSHVGSPEEGLDCDFSPIEVGKGSIIFSIGSGMGDMPSVPTAETAHQPVVVLVGLPLEKGEQVLVYEGEKEVFGFDVPFNFRNSSSLVTHPAFRLGGSYRVVTKGYEQRFTLTELVTTVR